VHTAASRREAARSIGRNVATSPRSPCANAAALGRPMTSDACARNARAASDAALVRWLRAISNR
jgi:hypothetical protein